MKRRKGLEKLLAEFPLHNAYASSVDRLHLLIFLHCELFCVAVIVQMIFHRCAEEGGSLATAEEKKRLEELLAAFPTTEAEDEKLLSGTLLHEGFSVLCIL